MRVDKSFRYRGNIQSTPINSHATLVLVWPGHESWENSHANSLASQLYSTLMQLLFSFDRAMRVEKTLVMQTISLLNSNSRLTKALEVNQIDLYKKVDVSRLVT
jgi:hypothetical protein